MTKKVELRGYQEKAVSLICGINQGSRIVGVLPTGGGKTVIAAEAINRTLASGKRVVFFAHRKELIRQTVNKLLDAGVNVRDIGVLMGAQSWNTMAPALVASISTWVRRSPAPADVVFIDECHRSCSASYVKVIEHYSSASVIGLTATPTGNLGDIYEAIHEFAKPSELIELGAIVEPVVYGAQSDLDLSGLRTVGGDFDAVQLERRVNTITLVGNLLKTWHEYAEGRATVCFAAGIEHSRHIVETFRGAGVAAEHLDGSTQDAERDAILGRLASGETTYVSNCAVLTEGWDCPRVKCVQLACPTKSLTKFLQSVGRGLRPLPDGTMPVILDHAMAYVFHGFPCEDRTWKLKKKGETKENVYVPPVRQCSKCEAIVSRSSLTCKFCGHAIELINEFLEAPVKLTEIKDKRKAHWDHLVYKWTSINENRIRRGQKPMLRYWISKQYEADMREKPPNKFVAPPEMYDASNDEILADWTRLTGICSSKGIPVSWAKKKVIERFGDPGIEFLGSL